MVAQYFYHSISHNHATMQARTPGDAGFDWSVPVAGDNQVRQKWL